VHADVIALAEPPDAFVFVCDAWIFDGLLLSWREEETIMK
jgi:hypothetical protein